MVRGRKELSRLVKIIYVLINLVITWVYTIVKNHQIVHLKPVHRIVLVIPQFLKCDHIKELWLLGFLCWVQGYQATLYLFCPRMLKITLPIGYSDNNPL